MSNAFVGAFEVARNGISLPKIANEMAERSGKNARGVSGNLYRLVKNNQTPKKETVIEIADALGGLRGMSATQTRELQDRLLNAAHPSGAQNELRKSLRPKCEAALAEVESLSDHEIASILDSADVATMKLIIASHERGEGIAPVRIPNSDTIVSAGRARIHIDGEITPGQRQILEKAAEMIEAVLQV